MPAAEDTLVAAHIEPGEYPWHAAQWAVLTKDLSRLSHALLLHGQAGLGKNAFALRLARFLLCLDRSSDGNACGRCRSCTLFRAGNHPDLLRVGPLEDSSQIVVDQVRGVIEFLSFKAHTASNKIVIVSPAEAMNINAANSLLKVLEEPPAGSLFILVATHPARVAVTIRSRCTQVAFNAPPLATGLAWLRSIKIAEPAALLTQAGGAPLAAVALAGEDVATTQAALLADLDALARGKNDPVASAERWKSLGSETCLDWLQQFLTATIRQQATSLPQKTVSVALQNEKQVFPLSIIDLFEFLDMVSTTRRQLGTGIDESLVLEHLLIRWSEISASAVRN